MKEGVGAMEGKEFVCHFCVSACLVARRGGRVERGAELSQSKLKEVREENGRLNSPIEQARLRVAQEEVMGDIWQGVRCEV